ncbi:MAG TPA: hypothetical protein PLO95_13235 [Spirochaetota bacterium]|nr:hypothetical protein [Spirochaetota bacterium]HQH31791.1 hypothetical protein [Spirochaetota bacterium]HQJ06612.1 hypothetical protein [Spirochaetota bacterium]
MNENNAKEWILYAKSNLTKAYKKRKLSEGSKKRLFSCFEGVAKDIFEWAVDMLNMGSLFYK